MYALSGTVGLLGLVFLVGNQGLTRRLIVGAVLLAVALAIAGLAGIRPRQPTAHRAQGRALPAQPSTQPVQPRQSPAEPIVLLPEPPVHAEQPVERPAPPAPRPAPATAAQSKCKRCGAELPEDAAQVMQGATYILCPSCGTFYRSQEASK